MKIATYGNFQVGMIDDPSIEDKGGFEFASGMDIFSDPGILKACNAMTEVTYGASATPSAVPTWMVDTATGAGTQAYISAGDKILKSTDGTTWNLFLTNSQGANQGLGIWAGYVVYMSDTKLGRAVVSTAASQNDSYLTGIDSDGELHPILAQGGTLKIGAGRYIASIDESFNLTARAMKLQTDLRVRCLAEYLTNLFMGTRLGAATGGVTNQGSSVFSWRGTVLSSGSALPDVPYLMSLRGMNALLVDGQRLYAFPDTQGDILIFNGGGFEQLRKLHFLKRQNASLAVAAGGVSQHTDNTILFGGSTDILPGVYQMRDKAICQAFVPAGATPGDSTAINIGFVKSSFNGIVTIGYYKSSNASYHIEKSTSNKQNNAVVKTIWHKVRTDRLKRWYGAKLNLKPLGSCSVAVAYRTTRDASFTSAGTITAANQDKPLFFTAQPRSREIQLQFTYTTSTTTTPELMEYDMLYDVINSTR